MSAPLARRGGARAMLAAKEAFAAVEFALMLPLVLVLYLGLAELALGQRASQKVELVAHSLSDLAAQQLKGGSNSGQAGMDETTIQAIFSAAAPLMSPLPTTNLKMTISEVTISADSTQASGYKASVNWTIAKNSGALRPCTINGVAKLNAADVPPVDPNSMPTSFTSAKAVTTASSSGDTTTSVTPTIGSIIVADVVYAYQPSFSRVVTWLKTAAPTMSRTSYSPVRNTYIPNHIQYYMTSGTNCSASP
ncbi:TadE/TadG family type IV pilus assembly protein [Methylosinus sp. Ce-a6]|uniref:TadE/TadG family type IV pilus assembly protein n=1 Tax=Methylosinus sp. Ce-a6 TaxID=2172005 RepID=UPI001356D932|nr:TadE/TadG family type IV pilus assembly protein [Methylosinus sp. Ce-a6]